MGLNPATFLSRLQHVVTGNGFKRSVPISLGAVNYIDGASLTATVTETGMEMGDTGNKQMFIFVDDDMTSMCQFNFVVPQDYDESIDKLRIRALMSMDGGTTDTVYLDAEVYKKRAGAAASADLDPTAETTAVPAAIASAAWSEVKCDSESLQGGDCLTVLLKTGAHTTDAIHIYGIEVVYAADLVYFDEDDRSIED